MTDPIRRAHAAKRELVETEAAFDKLRAAMVNGWIATPAEAAKTRETLYFSIQALDAVRVALREVVETGQIEAAYADLVQKAQQGR